MRTSNFMLILSLGLCFTLTACFTPRSIVQMEADGSENVRWSYGRQVIRLQSDSIEAAIFFDTHTKKHLIFDVEVTNWGQKEILVSPEEIYLHRTYEGAKVPAFDPEKEIFSKKVQASRQDANAKNLAVFAGVAAVATVVAVAAANDGGSNDNNNNGNITNIAIISTDVSPPPPSIHLPPDMVFWEDISLRKTTLAKGYKVGGKVVFPRMDQLNDFYISIPLDGKVLTGRFRQRIFQP